MSLLHHRAIARTTTPTSPLEPIPLLANDFRCADFAPTTKKIAPVVQNSRPLLYLAFKRYATGPLSEPDRPKRLATPSES
jgi:hypothetical protein